MWLVTRTPAEMEPGAPPVPSPANGSKPPPVPAIAEDLAEPASGNKRMRISVQSYLVARIDGLAEDAGTTRAEWARRRISTALSLGFKVPDDVDWGGDNDRFDLPLHLPYRHLRQIAAAAAVEGVPVHRWMHAVLAVAAGVPTPAHSYTEPEDVWCARCAGTWPCGCARAAKPPTVYCAHGPPHCGHRADHSIHGGAEAE